MLHDKSFVVVLVFLATNRGTQRSLVEVLGGLWMVTGVESALVECKESA